jgi:glycosyltransferase involved in cell wall biosynthesis
VKSQKLIIAQVIDAIHPYSQGGREVRYHELAQRLSDRVRLNIYTMHWWSGSRTRTEGGVTFEAVAPLVPMYAGSRRSFRQALLFTLGCFRLLGRRFDVLEADQIPYLQIFVLRLVANLRRKRLIVTWHEVWGPSYWREYLGRLGVVAWVIERSVMRLPDHIVAASDQTAERIRATLGEDTPVTVIPNGVDLDTIRRVNPDESTTDLVIVCRLIAHKRVNMLLDAVALLHAEGMPITCRVVGDGPEREALHRHAEAVGVHHAVDFRHEVHEQKEIYALMKAARVFAFPSAREGFGAAVLEALACGLPVVTTSDHDNLAQHLVARSRRGIVCEATPEDFAAAIKKCFADTEAAASGMDGGDESWLSEYSWDTLAERVHRVWQV